MKKVLYAVLAFVMIISQSFLFGLAADAGHSEKLADQTVKDFISSEDESKTICVAIWFKDSKTAAEYAGMSRSKALEHIKAANEENIALVRDIVSSCEADELATIIYAEVTPFQLGKVIALDEVKWVDYVDRTDPVAEVEASDKAADDIVRQFAMSGDDSRTIKVAIWFKTDREIAGMSQNEAREYVRSENENNMVLLHDNVISCSADELFAIVYAWVKPSGLKAILDLDEVNWVDYYDEQMAPETDGDVNLDGKIDAGDARMVLRYSAQLESITDLQKSRIDMDGDGNVTAADARTILIRSANIV